MIKKAFAALVVFLVIIGFCFPTLVLAAFQYVHDPMENPKAAEDIVVNPDAVYGYSPNPDSTRLGEFADAIDWTDLAQVSAAREQRVDDNDYLYIPDRSVCLRRSISVSGEEGHYRRIKSIKLFKKIYHNIPVIRMEKD